MQAGKFLFPALGLGRHSLQLLGHAREALGGLLCTLQLRLLRLKL